MLDSRAHCWHKTEHEKEYCASGFNGRGQIHHRPTISPPNEVGVL